MPPRFVLLGVVAVGFGCSDLQLPEPGHTGQTGVGETDFYASGGTTWHIESTDPSNLTTDPSSVGSSRGESTESGDGESTNSGGPLGPLVGPPLGNLLLHGGGSVTAPFTEFVALAGGEDAAIIIIPTAKPDGDFEVDDIDAYQTQMASTWGLTNVTVAHTRDPAVADTEAFAAPIEIADGVWFDGGRQWRIADAYLGTRTHEAFQDVLAGGGVIAGTSAGASIQASFLVRGDTDANTLIIGDHTEGLGFLRGVGIDQHIAERDRKYDLFELLEHDSSLLGIGLDEPAYIVVTEDTFDVYGSGQVYIHDIANWAGASTDDDKIIYLTEGDVFDMALRRAI